MPTKYSGRVILILAIMLVALVSIFPGFFRGDFRPALNPGIDMRGGYSLIYEIKVPEGTYSGDLATQVMDALKKRVDPDGVRNLIWRPQGDTRLEIQMPASRDAAETAATRTAFANAQAQLEATNVRSSEVIQVIERMSGEERDARLRELTKGSPARQTLYAELVTVYEQIQLAAAQRDPARQAEKELEYERLKSEIELTNLPSDMLEAALELGEEIRAQRLAEILEQSADYPERLAAIDQFRAAHVPYVQVKGRLDDAADLQRLLRGSGVLSFHILVTDFSTPEAQAMIERLQRRGPIMQANDEMKWVHLDRPEHDIARHTITHNDRLWALVYITPDKSMMNREGEPRWSLQRSYPTMSDGRREVGFTFDAQGASNFYRLTGANIGQNLGIVLDDKLISAPVIQSRIGGSGVISGGHGGFTDSEIQYLVSTLNAGSLPAQLAEEPISVRVVGPQLGEDNLRAGFIACIVGLSLVGVFMVGYYYIGGLVATFALVLNIVLILGSMAALNATFTLPGVAAIVLTIGMAVDANVLIFERLREEIKRGLSLRMAMRNAYDRAWSAIVDGSVTTAITALILYLFGSEEVKGFGLTLLIGLIWSMFTALFVTKTIFGLMIDKLGLSNLSSIPLTFPRWDRILEPKIDWVGKAWIFAIFSVVFIGAGMAAFIAKYRAGEMLDVEFASGTQVQFELKEPTRIEDVRAAIESIRQRDIHALPSPSIYSVGTDRRTFEMVTATTDQSAVKQAVLDALGDRLQIELPSHFAGDGQSVTQVLHRYVIPIKQPDQEIAGFVPPGLMSHMEGVAIVLQDLDPALPPSQIKARIDRQRLQSQPDERPQPYRPLTVVSPSGTDDPTTTAVVLVSDAALPHDLDDVNWLNSLAGPTWRLVNDAINRPADFQKVANIDASVAAKAQREATLALFLSVVGIMFYTWMRFGNLKYGSATVVALVHDALFTIAAIGMAHYVWETTIGQALLIEPFRINLTIIAAVLTVIGYSMNDTVVVFDRIRENRGKFGHVSRKLLNDSISQTLSRTLITGGTTLVTVTIMYVIGGSGIHGFTFALLVGILAGTYSSIVIAAPILLMGRGAVAEARTQPVGQLQRA